MHKSYTIWFIKNTSVTFQQIADFFDVHFLEVELLANKVKANNSFPTLNPILDNIVTKEEIAKAEKDPSYSMKRVLYEKEIYEKKNTYVYRAQRKYRTSAILWMQKKYPHANTYQVAKLLKTTQRTVQKIYDNSRNKKDIENVNAERPDILGFCTSDQLKEFHEKITHDTKK